MSDISKEIGQALMNVRKRKKISRLELAHRLGYSDVALYYWETGRNPIDVDTLKQYCDALNIDWIELLSSISVSK